MNLQLRTIGALAFAAASLAGVNARGAVGDKAPELEPSEWLNTKEKLSWATLKGRVILIEKWATW